MRIAEQALGCHVSNSDGYSSATGACAQVQAAMQGLYARAAWVPPKLTADERQQQRQQQRQQRKQEAQLGSVGAA